MLASNKYKSSYSKYFLKEFFDLMHSLESGKMRAKLFMPHPQIAYLFLEAHASQGLVLSVTESVCLSE